MDSTSAIYGASCPTQEGAIIFFSNDHKIQQSPVLISNWLSRVKTAVFNIKIKIYAKRYLKYNKNHPTFVWN